MPEQNMAPMMGEQNNMAASAGQEIGPNERANLQDALNQLTNLQAKSNAQAFGDKNQIDGQRQEALIEVFQIMQQAGVDPGNIDEVRSFLDMLEARNPQLYQDFVEAFEVLLGQVETGEEESPSEEANEGAPMGALAGLMQPTEGSAPMQGQEQNPMQQFPNLRG